MAFRKRNVAPGGSPASQSSIRLPSDGLESGVRPSPLTSHPATSTGTPSLDGLLGGHAGLPLGSSLLVEENGTTDYAGALLRFYAAEGICQGHILHVVGVGQDWVKDLPGVVEDRSPEKTTLSSADQEKMKIAWRYERLGQAGERALPDRSHSTAGIVQADSPFCHTFDLTKRIVLPPNHKAYHISVDPSFTFGRVIQSVSQSLASSAPNIIHRLVIPSILSPAIYPASASQPGSFLTFFRSLRSLLFAYPSRLTAMLTLPLELYPRASGLIRWAEILSDGVVELTPFPRIIESFEGGKAAEEQPQGMVNVHRLPVTTERGEGGAGASNSLREDLTFTVSRRKFVIKSFSLPPMEGDQEAQKESGSLTSKDVEF